MVHGTVGIFYEISRVRAVLGKEADPHARGDKNLMASDDCFPGDLAQNTGAGFFDLPARGEGMDNHGELVSPYSGSTVFLPDLRGNPPGNLLQQQIPRSVPQSVVDHLESVYIEIKDRP